MGDISFTGVINDLADKFMSNQNQKKSGVDKENLKEEITNTILQNNEVIGKELEKMREYIVQQGGQQQQQMPQQQMPQQQMPYPMAMPMPMGQMMPMYGQMPQNMPMPMAPVQKPMGSKKKGKGKKTAEAEPEVEAPMDEIDEALREKAMNNLEKEQDNSLASIPEKLIGSIGKIAQTALSTDDENMGPAAGEPLELPSMNNVMSEVGKGLSNAAETVKSAPDKAQKGFFGEMASNMTNNLVNGVKKIGKGALGTIDNATGMTNNVIKMATYKKCSPDFLSNIGSIIDTCDRDNYVEIYNIIIDKLKLKKNFFKDHVKQDIDKLESISLEPPLEVLTDEENTVSMNSETEPELASETKPELALNIAEQQVLDVLDSPEPEKKTKKKLKKKKLKKKKPKQTEVKPKKPKQAEVKQKKPKKPKQVEVKPKQTDVKKKKGTIKKGQGIKFLGGKELIRGINV